MPGIRKVNVNLVTNTMTLECADSVSAQSIIDKVSSIGYGATELQHHTTNNQSNKHDLIKQIISLALWLPLMIFAMATMHDKQHFLLFGIIQLVVTTAILILHYQFLKDNL